MNYLAHAFLSPKDNAGILVGNLAGDSIRHIDTLSLPEAVQTGIELHHLIDRTTDSNSDFKSLRSHISSRGFPYPGVMADLIIDFVLASRWHEFSAEPFKVFKHTTYSVLEALGDTVSGHFTFTSSVLVMEDWFESYRTIQGMNTAFYRLNRKTRREIPIKEITGYLQNEEKTVVPWGRRIISDVQAAVESSI